MLYIIIGALALILVGVLALLVRTARQAKAQTVALEQAQFDIKRLETELLSARRSVPSGTTGNQPNAADIAVGTTAAVEFGTAVIEAGHKTLAEGAFKVLDSFDSTREAGKVAQKLHDDNVDGVYSAITGLNRALGDAFRGFTTSRSAPTKQTRVAETVPEPTSEV